VSAAVDVRHGERTRALESVREVVESGFGERALELCRVGEEVEDTRCEVASQTGSAFSLADVDLKVGACEWPILNAASAGPTEGSEAKDVLSWSEFDVFAIAAKASCGREDFSFEGLCRVTVVRLCIKRPVPVSVSLLARVYRSILGWTLYLRLSALVATDFPQRLFVASGQVTMPLREEADEVNLVSLATMHCLEVVETIDRIESVVICELFLGDGLFGLQTEDSIDVLFLLDIRKSAPSTA
jgi:hypothetical protein